jgi:UDP-N-acetylmuramoyl-tripeptide--D-alanyl-D-alanine ligase
LNIPVIAITGSNGKTTTKELLGRVLNEKFKVFATPGNYNNHIGIPLSILQITDDIEFAVLEMGASAIGEIESYCQYARPNYGIITNVGKDHLEGFGSVEGVKQAKGELYEYLAKNEGMIFINKDEKHLPELAENVKQQFSYYESEILKLNENEFTAHLLSAQPEVVCSFRDRKANITELKSPLMGRHNFNNILTAMAVGAYFGLEGQQMKKAVESYYPLNNRSQLIQKDSITYILDAYNANPTSMAFMIQTLASFNTEKKGLILGEMLEMGEYSHKEHQAIVDMIKDLNDVAFVYLVGEAFIKTKSPESFKKFKNTAALKAHWDPKSHPNTTVLIKGSRRWKLEELIE